MYSLCHFTFFLFLDGKFGIKTLQKRISGKVSFHGEMEGEDACDPSVASCGLCPSFNCGQQCLTLKFSMNSLN